MTPTTEEAKTKGQQPRRMAEGCCSAVSPCSHQQRDPYSLCEICETCRKANGFAEKIQAAAPRTDSAERVAGEAGEFAASRTAGAIPSLEWTLRALEMMRAQSQKRNNLWVGNAAWHAIVWLEHLSGTPAPSSPGVPDSVRALSEALESTKAAADDLASVCIEEGDNKAAGALQFISGFISDQVAAISAHPAGQSEQPILRATVDVFADRTDTRLAFGDRTAPESGVKAVQQAIAALAAEYEARGGCPVVGRHPAGQSAGSGEEAYRVTVERVLADHMETECSLTGATQTDVARHTARSIAACIRGADLAPNSPRTGDEGTEEVRLIGPKMTPEQEERIAHNLCGEFGPDAVIASAAFVKAFYAELYAASHPAAPEAQGATRQPIETAPKDRSDILLFGALRDPDAKPSWFVGSWFPVGSYGDGWWVTACVRIFATEWAPLPAPPTSSGQGGR